ncbi:competence protein ComC [Prochlorococcus marinus]|uniref:competence protein ComC n=1 Tax=Prochlorococcus marinus TaxID=1219 RepID=UPI001AD9601B|nr:competence protein ComC [Prochlorococcus marinus]MBO8217059.1 competence protein ComC [Prochlorococcus marinus XMU1405]MBW3040287.1 competence protein ComC [Prochlorococcus marinus str. MU1405]MBW3047745.1 competence protein ComC [Prochlorococcus marinus str. MU1406]
MSLSKILNSLEKSWERDDILLNIKKGLGTDEIVNEFLVKNERQIKELNSLLKPEDIDLLNQVEQLSTCESKLINEIKNLNYLENNKNHHIMNKKKIVPSKRVTFNKISSFMINWSNKFVVIALLTISAIALSKQAWA